ncbi:hypothetical protein M0R45_025271 [Rubus argutus]|uniref:Uncharacterized protein n=1 Tax=Rubus argutus TaxID=59490 RepID=A0AAW1WTI9_RUBAR
MAESVVSFLLMQRKTAILAQSVGGNKSEMWLRNGSALDKFRLPITMITAADSTLPLHKLSCIIKKWKARHQIAADIQRIKLKKSIASPTDMRRYNFLDQAGSISARQIQHLKFGQGDALLLEEADLVAIGERKKQLIDIAHEGRALDARWWFGSWDGRVGKNYRGKSKCTRIPEFRNALRFMLGSLFPDHSV